MPKNKVLYAIIIILTIALTARIALFLGILIRNPSGFSLYLFEYWPIAENIVNHGSFSYSNVHPLIPDHSRTPLYPLFISSLRYVGLNATGIIFIQILLSSATCLLVILLTYKLIGNWQSAYLAGGIFAIDIPSIVLSNSLLSETLFTFLLTLSILYLVLYFKRYERVFALFASGVLMGLSILCRPIAIILPLFIILIFFPFCKITRTYIFRRILLYLVPCFVVVSPWLIRNQVVFGSMFLSTIGCTNLLYYRAAGVYAVKEGIPLSKSQELLREKAKSTFQGNIEQEPIKYKKFEAKIGASIILDYPLIYIRNSMLSVFNMLFKPIRSTIDLQLGLSKKRTTLTIWGKKANSSLLSRLLQKTSMFAIMLVVVQLFILVILWISSIYGIIITFLKREHLFFCIMVLVIAYFCIMSAGPEAYARFRVPILPFLAIMGGFGIVNAYERLEMKTKTRGEK